MTNTKHIHADNMMAYAQDALTTDKPWELWESRRSSKGYGWASLVQHPQWNKDNEYRHKLKQNWEPVGGEYAIFADGDVMNHLSYKQYKLFGTERQTQEQAEKARDKMRVFNRLLAYHDEFCPDYEFNSDKRNCFIAYSDMLQVFGYKYKMSDKQLCTVYFPEHIAKELVEKLNSSEVEL